MFRKNINVHLAVCSMCVCFFLFLTLLTSNQIIFTHQHLLHSSISSRLRETQDRTPNKQQWQGRTGRNPEQDQADMGGGEGGGQIEDQININQTNT